MNLSNMEVKQFWTTQEGLDNFNKTAFRGDHNLEITVPKDIVGKGKAVNTAVQVDKHLGPTGTVDNPQALKQLNGAVKSYKITPIVSED